ncbi:transcriptional activator RinB [Streptomyces sp. NPDC088090]
MFLMRRQTMIKHISKLIFTLAMYELGKYVTEQLLIKYTSNDDIEAPQDFTQDDHIHLNAEVSD